MIAKEIDRKLGSDHFGSAKVVIFLAITIEYAAFLSTLVAAWPWNIWEASHQGCMASHGFAMLRAKEKITGWTDEWKTKVLPLFFYWTPGMIVSAA